MFRIPINTDSRSLDSGHGDNDLLGIPNIEKDLIPIAQAASPICAFFKNDALKGLTVYYDVKYLREQLARIYQQSEVIKNYCINKNDIMDELKLSVQYNLTGLFYGRTITDYLYEVGISKQIAIYLMKKIIDAIICELACNYQTKLNGGEILSKIPNTDVGKLLNNNSAPDVIDIKNTIRFDKFECLLRTINDLFNAYKHSIMTQERYFLWSQEIPTFFVYYCNHGEIKNGRFENHNVRHVVTAFNDFLLFVFMGKEMTYTEKIAKGTLCVINKIQ